MSLANIGEAFQSIGDAFTKLPDAIKACKTIKEAEEVFADIGVIFSHPLKLLEISGKNILFNGKSITGHIEQSVSSYKAGDYTDFGDNIGAIIKIALGVGNSMKPVDVAMFMKGFFEEADGPCGDINTCIIDTEKIADLLKDIESQFKNFGLDSIKAAVKDIDNMLDIIPEEYSSCSAVPAETLHIVSHWSKDFANIPSMASKVVKAVWHQHKELYDNVTGFVRAFSHDQYEDAGKRLAEFIILIDGKPN